MSGPFENSIEDTLKLFLVLRGSEFVYIDHPMFVL